ncbi:MAG: site-specific integrase [Methylococcales bacterium]|nr:site-specific integrase [Methylococcales bacterium]
MTSPYENTFKQNYDSCLKHLKLKGLRSKTIESYSRGVRRIAAYFNDDINDLSKHQLTHYFSDLLDSHSWSAVKHDLYGIKFFYTHALNKTWQHLDLIEPPKVKRLPDIITPTEARHIFMSTKVLSYRVFYFTVYSMGLRLGEGLRLQVGDIDEHRQRVHIRNAKGNKDRFVPLPNATLNLLRQFWSAHRNPVLLFPNRHGGLKAAINASSPMDRGGVQATLSQVTQDCGIKKNYAAFSSPQLCHSST